LGGEGWDERRRGDGAGLGDSESQGGMTVGGRWRKEGSALAAPAAVEQQCECWECAAAKQSQSQSQ
jgi:hypothetical protein